jgi:outer membrane protein assembly factor BamA
VPSIRLASTAYERETNRVDVTFNVTAGPHATVQVNGAHVSNRALRRLIPIYSEGSVDQDLVDEGKGNLEAYFQTKGYFNAMTGAHLDQVDGTATVTYDVNLGSKHHVKSISFEGNHHFSNKQLDPQVSIKKGVLFLRGKYSEPLLTKSVTAVTQQYENDGYNSVSIQTDVKDVNSRINVTFRIQEGPQDKIASLQMTGNKTQTLSDLSRKHPLGVHVGGPYSTQLLDTGRGQLLASYLDLGYLNADVRSSATAAFNGSHDIDVTYVVEEGPQAKVSDIVVLGENITKPSFIGDVTKTEVKSSLPLSEGGLLQAESDLYDLGIFDWASIKSLRPITDQTQEQTLIKVHESPRNSTDIGGGLEIIPRDGNVPVNSVVVPGIPAISLGNKFTVSQRSFVSPLFTFDFARHDLFGEAQTATIGTVLSRLDQRAYLTYSDPRLHSSSWSSLFSVSAERTTENPIYAANLASASFQIDKALDRKKTKRVIARYSFQKTDLYDILIPGLVLPQDRYVRLSTIDGELLHDTRDNPLDAHKGIYQTFDFGITAVPLGASASFLRFLGQTAFYRQMTPWLVWANNFRLGLAQSFSGSFVPLSEEFFSGGPDSLRGFPIDGAGPQRPVPVCAGSSTSNCTLISVPVGGDMLFIVNSEARFPLPISTSRSLGGVIFYDGGNVYSNISLSQFADDFTHTVGAGLRYRTPIGPVRFDVGYRLTAVPGVKAIQYFVTFGQSF